MIPVGQVDAAFVVNNQGMDVCFDPVSQQQFLSLKLAITVSLPQLLAQLLELQRREGMAMQPFAGEAASAPASGLGTATLPVNPVRFAPGSPQREGSQLAQLSGAGAAAAAPTAAADLSAASRALAPAAAAAQQAKAGATQVQPAAATSVALATASALNTKLVDAIRDSNVQEVRLALQHKADPNLAEPAPSLRTPLHLALEVGGKVEIVNLLLQAKSNVNAVMLRGKTPLHFAIQQYQTLPPVVLRMLLSSKADLTLQDQRGMAPIDSAKMVAQQSCQGPGGRMTGAASSQVRQLLNEVTEQPTVSVCVIDAREVRNVLFADLVNDKLVFHTESALGLYSLKTKTVMFMKKLRQLQVQSSVQHISVNPVNGTVAVCLEVVDANEESYQNVSIIWPNGQLQDEEPLKLSIQLNRTSAPSLPATIVLSRVAGPQVLVSRLGDGQVYFWRLNSARSQLVSEVKLMDRAGQIVTSDDGCWIAAENCKESDSGWSQVEIWCCESAHGTSQNPKLVATLKKRPVSLALAQLPQGGGGRCLLAVAEAAQAGQVPPPIEILSVGMDGKYSSMYRVRLSSPCFSVSFCHGAPTHLISGHGDGLVVVYDLTKGQSALSHDSPGILSVAISADRSLLASAEANYFRVYRSPSLTGS